MNAQKGFTLIELMIVVAIIGILAAIAIPAYQDYTIRSQASEGPALANGLKTTIAEFYSDRGAWPDDNEALGISQAIEGSYVASVESEDGVITVTYGNKANAANLNGKVLTIRPALSAAGDIAWVCGYADAPSTTQPAIGTDATDVAMKYLPASCRS
ncbi:MULTISPECIES: pilin [unclassified Acinetobacter]|uniref:pilin n=1 Tax=unclassified Acinetobacter TaxID=196816 RepID=UPI0015D23F0A|nr:MULTISPECIES: pilin [unclassified Acinetobacter]